MTSGNCRPSSVLLSRGHGEEFQDEAGPGPEPWSSTSSRDSSLALLAQGQGQRCRLPAAPPRLTKFAPGHGSFPRWVRQAEIKPAAAGPGAHEAACRSCQTAGVLPMHAQDQAGYLAAR